ncbi:MAG: hypothetical protein ACLQEQ_06120 [Nitrososphaerales archaeon]
MSPKFAVMLVWLMPSLPIVMGLMKDFTLFNIQFPFGSSIAVSFEQFDILSSITVLFIRESGRLN